MSPKFDWDLLKLRVAGRVTFMCFVYDNLYYTCDYDNFTFTVPISDTVDGAVFQSSYKGSFFMRWIRKSMEEEDDAVIE